MAGTPAIDVYNRALFEIGVTGMNDPAEVSPQARVARALFAVVARSELRKSRWSFAMARATLPAVATSPDWGYANAFQLPSDFLRLVFVNGSDVDITLNDVSDSGDNAMFTIEGQQILTDLPAPLQIRYVQDLSGSPQLWDAAFIDVFACKLGEKCSPNLTKSDKTTARAAAAYERALAVAKRINAIELPTTSRPDASWMTTRAY